MRRNLRQYFGTKNVQNYNASTKKLCAKLWYEKGAPKLLVKLTPEIVTLWVFQ
jgi:hypothetical protein